MMISKFVSGFGFEIDKASVKRVDDTLNRVERRLRKLGTFAGKPIKLDLTGFNVDQKRLNFALGNALDIASRSVTFEVNRFVVNQGALNRSIGTALERASLVSNARVATPSRGVRETTRPSGRVGAGIGVGSVLGGALAVGLGGYGLSQLNKRNQEVVAAQLQTQAVMTGNGGTAAQGEASFDWLRKQANRVGFNYLEASGDFNVLTSNLLGAGGTVDQAQNIFKGFAEYGRVNKLSPARQKLVFNALSQIAGKDKLQAEELTKQLGNSLPGAKTIFAQAYQQMLKEKGQGKGDLTGSAAIIALEADMKKGLVRGDILNYAANIASEKSQPGLAKASTASQAEQGRYQNSVNDLAVVASNAGVEEGFARIFRTLSTGLSESSGLVGKLAEGFNEATKVAEKLLLFPQSFTRAIQGRDSLVADWLGEGQTKELREDWSEIKASIEEIFGMKSPEWINPLKDVAQELKDLIAAASGISGKYRETKQVAQQVQEDSISEYGELGFNLAGKTGQTIGQHVGQGVGLLKANYFTLSSALGLAEQGGGYGLNKVMDTLPFAKYTPVSGLMSSLADSMSTPNDTVAKYYVNRDRNAGLDVDSMYGPNGEGWRDFNKERNRSLALDVFGNNGYGPNGDPLYSLKSSADTYKQGETQQASTTTTNLFKAEFNVTGDRGDIMNWVQTGLSQEIQKVMVNLPEK